MDGAPGFSGDRAVGVMARLSDIEQSVCGNGHIDSDRVLEWAAEVL